MKFVTTWFMITESLGMYIVKRDSSMFKQNSRVCNVLKILSQNCTSTQNRFVHGNTVPSKQSPPPSCLAPCGQESVYLVMEPITQWLPPRYINHISKQRDMASIQQTIAQSNKTAVFYDVSNFTPESSKPKLIQTSSTFLTLSPFIHYTSENGS